MENFWRKFKFYYHKNYNDHRYCHATNPPAFASLTHLGTEVESSLFKTEVKWVEETRRVEEKRIFEGVGCPGDIWLVNYFDNEEDVFKTSEKFKFILNNHQRMVLCVSFV